MGASIKVRGEREVMYQGVGALAGCDDGPYRSGKQEHGVEGPEANPPLETSPSIWVTTSIRLANTGVVLE